MRAWTVLLVVGLMACAGCEATTETDSGNGGSGSSGGTKRTHKAKVVARESASGDYAIAQASGTVKTPGKIQVLVDAKPPQQAMVTWNATCSKGAGAGSKDDQFNATTPVRRAIKLPMRNADDCIVSANAQFDKGGKVTVRIRG